MYAGIECIYYLRSAMNKILQLYNDGHTIQEITALTQLDKVTVESVIIEFKLKKLEYHSKEVKKNRLENIISLNKEDRINFIRELPGDTVESLENEILEYISDHKNINYEDIISIVWLIGELQMDSLSEILCQFSSSKNGNIQRIVYSSMGKLINSRFIPYLKMGCKSSGIQIRMYSIKSLEKYNFDGKKHFFEILLNNETNANNISLLKKIINEVECG